MEETFIDLPFKIECTKCNYSKTTRIAFRFFVKKWLGIWMIVFLLKRFNKPRKVPSYFFRHNFFPSILQKVKMIKKRYACDLNQYMFICLFLCWNDQNMKLAIEKMRNNSKLYVYCHTELLFNSFKQRFQKDEKSLWISRTFFTFIALMFFKCEKPIAFFIFLKALLKNI